MIFINTNNNEEILFGFHINGIHHVCHKTPRQNQTVTNTRKTRVTLIFYANSFTVNVSAFATIYFVKYLNYYGMISNNGFVRHIINLSAGAATALQSWTASTTKKTLFAITLNDTFAITNIAIWPYTINFNGVITSVCKFILC